MEAAFRTLTTGKQTVAAGTLQGIPMLVIRFNHIVIRPRRRRLILRLAEPRRRFAPYVEDTTGLELASSLATLVTSVFLAVDRRRESLTHDGRKITRMLFKISPRHSQEERRKSEKR